MNTEVRYVLKGELNYATKQGDRRPAEFLLMCAPKGKHSQYVARLRQATMKAGADSEERAARVAAEMLKTVSDVPDDPAPEMPTEVNLSDEDLESESLLDGGMWIVNMVARSSVDLSDFYAAARSLFRQKGVVLVDGEVSLTDTLMDEMTALDFEGLVGSYVAGFTLPS